MSRSHANKLLLFFLMLAALSVPSEPRHDPGHPVSVGEALCFDFELTISRSTGVFEMAGLRRTLGTGMGNDLITYCSAFLRRPDSLLQDRTLRLAPFAERLRTNLLCGTPACTSVLYDLVAEATSDVLALELAGLARAAAPSEGNEDAESPTPGPAPALAPGIAPSTSAGNKHAVSSYFLLVNLLGLFYYWF